MAHCAFTIGTPKVLKNHAWSNITQNNNWLRVTWKLLPTISLFLWDFFVDRSPSCFVLLEKKIRNNSRAYCLVFARPLDLPNCDSSAKSKLTSAVATCLLPSLYYLAFAPKSLVKQLCHVSLEITSHETCDRVLC